MKYNTLLSIFNSDKFQSILANLYGDDISFLKIQNKRYIEALKKFVKLFDTENIYIFSSPGRIEIIGNHTDHNNGLVVGSSINRDMIAFAAPTIDDKIIIVSEGFNEKFVIPLNDFNNIKEGNQTSLLIKGMLKGLINYGYKIGGFCAYVKSDIIKGSGISSSACFEMLLLSVLNYFYNNGKIDILTLARIGQFAENSYWLKPSGLLDQLTTSYGGIITIDFKQQNSLKIEKLSNIFKKNNYAMVLVNPGRGHEELTNHYADIVKEMKAVARIFRKKTLREINEKEILKKVNIIRKKAGDRALLRAIHFFNENKRVEALVEAINKNNFPEVLKLINESGNSSWMLLQNCYIPANVNDQNISVAITLTKEFLNEKKVDFAVRIHGGGFAGVILVVLPETATKSYCKFIETFFGKFSTIVMSIRDIGIVNLNNLF